MFDREIIQEIKEYLFTDDIILLYWARQVWKTSIMKLLQKEEKRKTLFFDLEWKDDFGVVNQSAEDFVIYLKQMKKWDEETPLVIFIDEIQYLEDPTPFLKYLHDHYPNLKIVISWSSTLDIRNKMKDSLVWRYVKFDIYPLNFREFLLFKWENQLADLVRKPIKLEVINNQISKYYREYCIYWWYPKPSLETSLSRKQKYLNQIIETYIEKDISDVWKIKNVDKFNRLITILASQSWNLLNVSELASDGVWISRDTINERLLILKNTFIISQITPFSWNIRSELVKTPKLFFEDSGIRNTLLNSFELDWAWLENAIYNDIHHSYRFDKQIHFYRTKDKKEIDFIFDKQPFEVKLSYDGKRLSALEYYKSMYEKEWIVISLRKVENKLYNVLYPREV